MRLHLIVAATVAATLATGAYADPPPWAGRHRGWHHGHYERDYYGPGWYAAPVIVAGPPAYPVIASHPYVAVDCTPHQPIIGTIVGGIAGGLIGNQFGRGSGRVAATVGGTLLGALVGNRADMAYSQVDEDCIAQSFEYARPGTQVVWNDPDAETAYSVMPVRNFQQDGRHCREYQSQVQVGGQIRNSSGTACREADGSWHIMD